MRQIVHNQPAYLLRRYPYKDQSSLYDFLTREYGIVRLIQTGGRNKSQRRRHYPQLCTELLLDWRKGRRSTGLSNLTLLAPAPGVGGFLPNPSFARLLMPVSYMNELALRFFKSEDPHPELYDCYRLLMGAMPDLAVEPLMRTFEFHLLKIAGFDATVNMGGRSTTSPAIAQAVHSWLQDCAELGYRLEHGLRPQLRVEDLRTLCEQFARLQRKQQLWLRQFLRERISAHLGTDQLKTRKVIQQMHEITTPG